VDVGFAVVVDLDADDVFDVSVLDLTGLGILVLNGVNASGNKKIKLIPS
jgi:hypothetical protein